MGIGRFSVRVQEFVLNKLLRLILISQCTIKSMQDCFSLQAFLYVIFP